MKRPFGITIIAILALLSGLFGLCWPILAFLGSTLLGPLAIVGVVAGIFLIIGPVLQLVFAYGAFKLRSWAWYLGIISSGITVVGVIINLFEGASFWSAIWGSILPIIIFIYLLTPNVRQAFGEAPQQLAPVAPTAQAAPSTPVKPPPAAETPAADEDVQK